nr:NAD-dependent epimerase/dehydratase family protein [Dactylosporangium thailandense]
MTVGARVAVTGGRGFIGARLARRLSAAGARPLVIDVADELGGQQPWEAGYAREDVRDAIAIAEVLEEFRPDTVFHLAAMHYIPDCERWPDACVDVNVKGTRAVLRACAAAGVPRVVVASSAAVYEPSEQPHTIDSPAAPTDVYGHTKLFAEHLARTHARDTGASVGIARLFNVVGPDDRNPHLLPSLAAQALDGDVVTAGDLGTARDYVYVDDVCAALVGLAGLEHPGTAVTVNVGSEVGTTGTALLDLVREATGKPLPVVTDADRLRPSDRPVLVSDCTQTRELLGWRASTGLPAAVGEVLRRPRLPAQRIGALAW